MVDPSQARGCCSGVDVSSSFDERAELGHRRLVALRRVAAWSSLALTVASLLCYVHLLPFGPQVAQRLALAAALVGVPRLLGHLRRALVARRLTLPAVVGSSLVVVALAGYPLPVAVVVATVLAADSSKTSRTSRNRHTPAYGGLPAAEPRHTPAYGVKG